MPGRRPRRRGRPQRERARLRVRPGAPLTEAGRGGGSAARGRAGRARARRFGGAPGGRGAAARRERAAAAAAAAALGWSCSPRRSLLYRRRTRSAARVTARPRARRGLAAARRPSASQPPPPSPRHVPIGCGAAPRPGRCRRGGGGDGGAGPVLGAGRRAGAWVAGLGGSEAGAGPSRALRGPSGGGPEPRASRAWLCQPKACLDPRGPQDIRDRGLARDRQEAGAWKLASLSARPWGRGTSFCSSGAVFLSHFPAAAELLGRRDHAPSIPEPEELTIPESESGARERAEATGSRLPRPLKPPAASVSLSLVLRTQGPRGSRPAGPHPATGPPPPRGTLTKDVKTESCRDCLPQLRSHGSDERQGQASWLLCVKGWLPRGQNTSLPSNQTKS